MVSCEYDVSTSGDASLRTSPGTGRLLHCQRTGHLLLTVLSSPACMHCRDPCPSAAVPLYVLWHSSSQQWEFSGTAF